MAEREIGVGVIGFGLGGRVFHAPFVSAVNGLRLAAIMQRKGDEAAKAYPATKIARSLEELLADKSIELVVVSTPNETHFALAKQALEAGKHVVIDKPFAATSEEALALGQLAEEQGSAGDSLPQPPLGRRLPDRQEAARRAGRRPPRHLRVALRPLPSRPAREHMEGGGESSQRNALRPRPASRRSGACALRRSRRHHRQRARRPRPDGHRRRLRHHPALPSRERQRTAGPLPHQLPGLRQRAALPAARHQRQLPQARPRPAGARAGRWREGPHARLTGGLAAGGRIGVGHAHRRSQSGRSRQRSSRARSRPSWATIAAFTPTCATQSSAPRRSPSRPRTATASSACWSWPAKAPPKAAP